MTIEFSGKTSVDTGSGMHVALCLAPAKFGGLESSVLQLAEGLIGQGVQVTLVLLTGPTAVSTLEDSARSKQMRVVRIEHGSRAYYSQYSGVKAVLAREKVDLVHTHGYHADLIVGAAAKALGLPVISTFHGFTGGSVRNRLYERLQRRMARNCSATIAVASTIEEDLLRHGIGRHKVHHIPNAFSSSAAPVSRSTARRKLGIPPDTQCIGWVGRLSFEKGPDLFVEVLVALEKLNSHPYVVIVGDGPMRTEIESNCSANLSGAHPQFTGFIPSMGEMMSALDLLVLTSRTEGTPVTILECMAAQVPVAAFAVGGVGELLTPDGAYLLPSGDVSGLAERIAFALANDSDRNIRTARTLQRLERNFNFDTWIRRHLAIYIAAES